MTEQTLIQTAPDNVSELLEKLDASVENLPKRLKQCAVFTRRHLHLIAVSTVSEMAESAGVAPSVYMRFCQALGFSGYSTMQALFRAQFTEFRPNYQERMALLHKEGNVQTGRLLADFVESGHRSLLTISNTITSDHLEQIASALSRARVVHLVGLRRAFCVVSNMAYLFEKLGIPTHLHYGTGMLDSTGSIFDGDVLFAVTFSPFSEETIRLTEATSKRGIPVYGLTDSERCPMSEWAKEMLIAQEDELAGFRVPNAAITLTTALVVAVKAMKDQS